MKNKSLFIMLAAGVFFAAIGAGYWIPKVMDSGVMHNRDAAFTPPSVPKKQTEAFAKHFSAFHASTQAQFLPNEAFLDRNGKKVRVSDFQGRPVLVNLWARWCPPCIVELPSLQAFAKRYQGKIDVVAIAMEQGKGPEDINPFLEMRGIGDFAGYVDQSGLFATNLGLRGIPTSFLLGSNGQILYRFEGDAEWTHPDAIDFFDVFLLQSP